MGVRLYPTNGTSADLEALAGVPAGTWDRLQALEAEEPRFDVQEWGEWRDRLAEDRDADRLHMFALFGWGRLTPAAYQLIDAWGMDRVCGTVQDGDKVQALLGACGVDVLGAVTVEGVYWC